jgi:ribosomal protein S18 acetylase RimI-like enzyme
MMATDMLVDVRDFVTAQRAGYSAASPDVEVRRADDADREALSSFIAAEFGERWARGTAVAYERDPASAFIALRAKEIIGFAFYDISFLGYFGAMGVRKADRGRGIGARLLIAALKDMALKGYAYAVIGDVGPIDFYEKVCGAIVIGKGD